MQRKDVARCGKLGKMGENRLAIDLLMKAGFENIEDLNEKYGRNFPFADICAERNGRKYAISVKARNKYEKSGGINPRYKFNNPNRV